MKTMDETMTRARTGLAGRRLLAIAVMIGGTTLAACEDDPIDPHDHEEEDVAGFRLDLLAQTPGGGGRVPLFTYGGPESADTLRLPAGSTLELEIVWLDEHGDAIELDEAEHTWQLEDEHVQIASIVQPTTEAWRAVVTTADLPADAVVYGGVRVRLFHAGEEEFTTPLIDVGVEGE